MHHRLVRFHTHVFPWHHTWSEALLAFLLALLVFVSPVSAAMRLQERSLYMQTSEPGATTSYTLTFRYMTPAPVGSVDMLFCIDPIPYHPCVTPPGLDASNVTLAAQDGETGYSILSKSTNHIVLSRPPALVASSGSSYKLDNIVNPTDVDEAFSIRLKTLGSSDGTGAQIDFGSVRAQVASGIVIETQVPPMLIFCVAEEVEDNCASTNETYYTNMGQLDTTSTLVAHSQMAVGTNASGGFAITAIGSPPTAGTTVVDSPSEPTASNPGTTQFAINLVANSDPAIGRDPEGTWANAVTMPDYGIPNQYKYTSGDVVAYSPNVSLMKKFTVSYILNAGNNLRAGVYSTTITYIASGRF